MRIKITVEKIPDKIDEALENTDVNSIMTYETDTDKTIYGWEDFLRVFFSFLGYTEDTVKEYFSKNDDEDLEASVRELRAKF